jgi:hypothetical protein
MAKKHKKAVKRKRTTAASAAASLVTREELQDALIVTIGGEASLSFAEVYLPNPTTPAQEFVVTMYEPAPAVTKAERDEGLATTALRDLFRQKDFSEMPYMRVVGRIIDILVHHRGFTTCSGGDVFHVLLKETPSQSGCDPNDYELAKPTRHGHVFDVTQSPGRKTVDNRLKRLKEDGWVTLPRKNGYVLTPKGRLLFDGWPDLAEIPGLTLIPAPTPATTPAHARRWHRT